MEVSKTLKAVVVFALLEMGGCATTDVPNLWPPASGTPARTIYVSLDTWHAMIGFTREDLDDYQDKTKTQEAGLQTSSHAAFEEWGYAERAWYLEGRHGVSGIFRAMAAESEGIVEIADNDRLWAKRTPQPPADLFTFHLSEEGYERLRKHLRSTIVSTTPVAKRGDSRFYRASRPYSLAHHCHHYVALALQEAGLPISSYWGLNRTSLASQLQEAEKLATDKERSKNN